MILHLEKEISQKYICKNTNKRTHYDFFFKNICLQTYKSRLSINANKFNALISNFTLAWSYKFNEKAYANRRRILRRNTCSSH